MLYLIQGFFFQRRPGIGIAHGSNEGAVAVIRDEVTRTMFAGFFGDGGQGIMQDHFGTAFLMEVELTESTCSFVKTYEHRPDSIGYKLEKRRDGAWHGSFEGRATGSGPVVCWITSAADHLAELPMDWNWQPARKDGSRRSSK